jgi:3-dehydroquinate dehydratase-2
MKRVLLLNGPNLDLLGKREPEIYGRTTLAELVTMVKEWGSELGIEVDHLQSNHEGELVERIHAAARSQDGLVINAAALSHYSRAIEDALRSVALPAVEVHISNIRRREPWRRKSVIEPACVYTIYGRGLGGYRWALRHLAYRTHAPFSTESYGPFRDQVGDFRKPSPSSSSLAVLVHGGLWRDEWTRDTMDGLAVALADEGYATWNLEYRRVGSGGGWPESFDDVATALSNAEEVTGIGASQTFVVGHSAGGTMALWSSGRSARLHLVIGLAAITDLVRAERDDLGDGSIRRMAGRRRPKPSDYSPFHRLPNGTPLLLASGTHDRLVPLEYGREFVAAAGEAGDEVEHLQLDCGHLALIEPGGEPWQAIVGRLRSRIPPL